MYDKYGALSRGNFETGDDTGRRQHAIVLFAMNRPAAPTSERLAEDYRALCDSAAVVDLGAWTVLEILGSETRSFLQGTATQEFDSRPPIGHAAPTLFLTEKGRPVAHAWVSFERQPEDPARPKNPETAWILSDPGTRETLRPHLERFHVMEDVEVRGPDEMPRLFGVAGPKRAGLLAEMVTGGQGVISIAAEPLSFVLVTDGTWPDRPIAGAGAFEAWRIRMGLPLEGIDFDSDRIATELTLPEAISETKGCYVGQEVVARTSHRGKPRRRRFGFRFPWNEGAVAPGTLVHASGAECGFVTSVTREPGTQDGIGMGYAAPEALDSSTDLHAVQGENSTLLRRLSWPL